MTEPVSKDEDAVPRSRYRGAFGGAFALILLTHVTACSHDQPVEQPPDQPVACSEPTPSDAAVMERAVAMAQGSKHREWLNTWLGVPVLQFPTDLMTYQALIEEVKPDFVIESGTALGGLSLYLATVLENVNPSAKVLTIDINDSGRKKVGGQSGIRQELRDRIVFLLGSSTSPEIFATISSTVRDKRVLVILDSLHNKPHVLQELRLYAPLVSIDSYFVVNDTHWDTLEPMTRGAGPFAAVREFLASDDRFIVDHTWERFMISCFHSGVLKRVR